MKHKLFCLVFIAFAISCSDNEEYKEYHSNGEVKLEGIITNGKKNGDWLKYDSLGKMLSLMRYSLDTLRYREFYNNGILYSQEEMRGENVKHGITKTYYPSGQIESISNFVFNKELGEHVSYHPNGQLYTKYVEMENGLTTEFHQYYSNGELSVYAKEMQNGEVNVYDSLGNRMIDLLMRDFQVVDTLNVY